MPSSLGQPPGGQAETRDDRARAPPVPGLRDGSQRAGAGRRLAPESDTTDQTVYDSLELLTGTDLKWFRNQGLIFRLKNL